MRWQATIVDRSPALDPDVKAKAYIGRPFVAQLGSDAQVQVLQPGNSLFSRVIAGWTSIPNLLADAKLLSAARLGPAPPAAGPDNP